MVKELDMLLPFHFQPEKRIDEYIKTAFDE